MKLTLRKKLLEKVENTTETPMLILSVVYVVVALLPDIAVLSPDDLEFLDGLLWIVWGIFATELLVKIFVSPKPLQYMMQNWPDVLIVRCRFCVPCVSYVFCWCCPKRGDKPNRFCAKKPSALSV